MDAAPPASQNRRTVRALLLSLLALPMASCSDADVVGAHLNLQADGSGRATLRSLLPTEDPGPAEATAKGVQFERRARLHSSDGRFADIAEVELGGITFQRDGQHSLRVTLPRGPDVQWPGVLAPAPDAQGDTARTFDPDASVRNLGSTIRLVIEVPGTIVSLGCFPVARGVEWDKEKRRASLWVPVRTALQDADELVWDISWKD